jgi:RHS repeat-associated protein
MSTFPRLAKHHSRVGLFLSAFALALLLSNTVRGQVGNDNPTGPAGNFNGSVTTGGSYDPYTANVTRTVTDMVVTGAVGQDGLSWSRTWNSRSGFGSWQHNYSWTIDPIDAYAGQPMHRIVTFPDGRVVNYGSMVDGNGYYGSPPGVSERLKNGPGNGLCFLILPDGGRVEFSVVSTVEYDWEEQTTHFTYDFTAQAVIDPHGLRTTLTYEPDGSFKVTEPAGRWIRHSFIPASGGWNEKVTASDGREVNYTFQTQPVAPGTVPHRLLTSLSYYDGTTAVYTYQAPNVGSADGVPLLSTCDDPMYAGPMRKISYAFATGTNPDGSEVVYGQILSEKHPNGTPVSTLTINSPTTRTETRGDGPARTFTYTGGKLTNHTDFKNQSSSMSYDARGFVSATVDQRQNQIDISNEPRTGKPTLIIHPLTPPDIVRATVQFEYGSPNCPDPNNRDGNNPYYLYRTVNERGYATVYWRDANKRVSRIDYPDGGFETFTYNGFGQVLTHRLTSGGIENFGYDEGLPTARGLRTSYTPPPTESDGDPSLHPTRYHYDSMDRVYSVTDPRGNISRFQYNARGQITRVTHMDDKFVQVGYDNYGNRASVTDELLNPPTIYTYDDYNRVLSVENPLGKTTTVNYAHDWTNPYLHTTRNPKYVNSPLNKNVVFGYDENLRRAYKVDALSTPDEAWTLFGYDAAGNLTSVTDPRGKLTSSGYDERNRQTSVTDALNFTTTVTYDATNNKKGVTRPGNPAAQFIDYDPMNRLREQIDERGVHTYANYDLAGNLSWLKDANEKVYSYEYDDLNRKIKATYPADSPNEPRTEKSTYDIAGNLLTFTNRAGAVQTYASYDNRNRVTSSSWNDGITPSQNFDFDAKSRLKQISSTEVDGTRTDIDFLYDGADRKTSEKTTVRHFGLNLATEVVYQYDDDGNRSRIIYPAGPQFIYAYTQRDQLANIKLDPAIFGSGYESPAVSYAYDASGNRSLRTLLKGASTPNAVPGASTQYAVDDVNRVYSQSTNFPNQPGRFDYGYDALNRRKYEQRDSGLADGFEYDPTGQVTGYQKSGTLNVASGTVSNPSAAATLTFDGAGNRTQIAGSFEFNTYTSNALNQYTNDAAGPAGYDNNGNLNSYAGWTVSYDAMNRLTELSHPGTGQQISYRYDALNRRIAQKVVTPAGTAVTTHVYDGWNLIEERPTDGRQPHCYLFGGAVNELVVSFGSGYPNYWYFQDGRGNTSHLTDNEHAVIERYTYSFDGRVSYFNANNESIPTSSFDNRFLFAGAILLPETMLYDMRNRIYYPRWGRFLQSDPIGFAGGDANLYRYGGGDPVNKVDPTGLSVKEPPPKRPLDGRFSMDVRDVLTGLGGGDWHVLGDPFSNGERSVMAAGHYMAAIGAGFSPGNYIGSDSSGRAIFKSGATANGGSLTLVWIVERGAPFTDSDLKALQQDIYPRALDLKGKGGTPEFWLKMWKLDTPLWNDKNQIVNYYYTGVHQSLNGRTWTNFEINYIGVGQGFAAGGYSVSRMNEIILRYNELRGFPKHHIPGKQAWAEIGYNYFMDRQ